MTATDLLKANATVALGTLVSRLTGLARWGLMYGLLSTQLNDSFNVANNVPNMLYELVIGGILTATLIPMFAEFADNKDTKATDAIVGTAMTAVLVLAVVATAISPLIIRLYTLKTPSTVNAAHYRSITTLFGLLVFPQILFYGVTFLASALLNARGRFRAAAWAPAVNNVVFILIIGSFGSKPDGATTIEAVHKSNTVVLTLGIGATIGIAAMALTVWVALRSSGQHLRLRPNRQHPAVQRVLKLSKWTVGYTIANQASLYVMNQLAGSQTGGWSNYLLGFVLLQLPIGLLAMSVTTTFGPELARARLAHDKARLVDRMQQGLRVLAALLLPAGAGMFVLARPLIAQLEHGPYFHGKQPEMLASLLAAFSVGLFSLGGYLFLLRVFYAHNDTRTPFALNVVENVINIVLGFILFAWLGVPGLAWSVSIAYSVTLIIGLYSLDNKLGGIELRDLFGKLFRLAIAAVLTGELAWLASRLVGSDTGSGSLLRLAVGIPVGIVVYVATLAFLKAPELTSVRGLGRN